GPDAVAVDFRGSSRFRISHRLHEVSNRLLARPAPIVYTGIDDEPHSAKEGVVQVSELAPGIGREKPHLVSELFGIKRPAFTVSGEPQRAADHGQTRGF